MQDGDGVIIVKLKKVALDFSIRLNKQRRHDHTLDRAFVQGLVTAVFGVHKVKSGALNPALIDFIKGLQ